jgi:hypothetical protein
VCGRREKKCTCKFDCKSMKEGDYLGDIVIDERILGEWILIGYEK